MSTKVKSFFNEGGKFPTGNIIVYESGNCQCYRLVDKPNTWYWAQGQSFDKVEEVTEAWGLFITKHPMEEPGLKEEYQTQKAAFMASTHLPKSVFGEEVRWKIERTI